MVDVTIAAASVRGVRYAAFRRQILPEADAAELRVIWQSCAQLTKVSNFHTNNSILVYIIEY